MYKYTYVNKSLKSKTFYCVKFEETNVTLGTSSSIIPQIQNVKD